MTQNGQSDPNMECEEFILPDWSPPDNPIQSERAKRASSSIMECEEFILPDWSPPAAETLVFSNRWLYDISSPIC